jgi:hypothetical protein
VEVPNRLGWLKSARVLRLLSALVALAVLGVVLYNATAVDRVPPTCTINLSATAPDSDLAPLLASVNIVFNEDVRPKTAEKAFSITPEVAGSFHWQGYDRLIFTPSAKLPPDSTFHVMIAAGVEDLAGNAQSNPSELTFTTVGAPAVKSVSPGTDQQGVAVDTPIVITFDRWMDDQKVLAGLSIEPALAYQATWNGVVLTLKPNNPLSFDTTYTLRLGDPAVDTDGTRLSAFATRFTTVGMGLRAISLVPTPNVAGVSVHSPIAVVFDGSIDPASISGAIHLTPPVNGSISTTSLADDRTAQPTPTPAGSHDSVLVFTPDGALAAHTTYTVSMSSSVRRTDGQAAAEQSWTFTTGEPSVNGLNQIVFLSDRGGVANVWLMNPDGSNPRQVTAELVPVSGFDVSGDGSAIAYTAGGVVKRMGIGGDNMQVVTASGRFEYAPAYTPDGTGLVLGRRDPGGIDKGYWRIPLISGADVKQLLPDGAPGLASVTLGGDGLTDSAGRPSWAPRVAFSTDGKAMLIVRGSDDSVELVDMTGAATPVKLSIKGNSRPVWVQTDSSFYVVGTSDNGASWAYWRVSTTGGAIRIGPAAGDLSATADGRLALLVSGSGGATHLGFASNASSGSVALLTQDATWSERSPSFSPDGSQIVFSRVGAQSLTVSAGIWVVNSDGTALLNLATDGAYPRWMP